MKTLNLPTYDDLVQSAGSITGAVNHTLILTSRTVNDEFGAEVFLKCKKHAAHGAFKFRGAFNALSKFTPEQRRAGVVAFSSGNHAQAIALAVKLLGMPATIVMPHDALAAKVAATMGYGGNIVVYDHYKEDRKQIGRDFANEHGLNLIASYDHPDIIAGQGTAAKELFSGIGILDAAFVPLGGGLLAGSALATRALSSQYCLYGVEPEAGNNGQQSFRSGTIFYIYIPKTIADCAQTQHLGHYTYPVIQLNVDDILTVSDDKLVQCKRFLRSA